MRMLLNWLLSALAVWIVAQIVPGVHVSGAAAALIAALAIGCGRQEESGLDRTLLGAEFCAEVSPPRISDALATAGLVCTFVACSDRGKAVYLIEVEGFAPISDRRLDALRSELGAALERLLPLGGYAAPLSPPALATKG